MVVGIPDSGMSAAYGYAHESGLPLRQGVVRNRIVDDRSFISPNGNGNGKYANDRQTIAFEKLIANPGVVAGEIIVLVDDSVVRGNTMAIMAQELRNAGVAQIHLRVGAPPIISECHYGVDISSKEELVAVGRTDEQIAAELGVDSIAYLSLPNLRKAVGAAAVARCYGCMTGVYPTESRKPIASAS
jgi:amidophosphoribosyltransferase